LIIREITTTLKTTTKDKNIPEAKAHGAMSDVKRLWKDEERHLPQAVLQT
jgi:hypothetical protein